MAVSKPIRCLAAAALLMIGCADLAQAQDKPDNFLMRLFNRRRVVPFQRRAVAERADAS